MRYVRWTCPILISALLCVLPAWATVPDSPAADRYVSNGFLSYPYTFKVYAKEALNVYVDNVLKTVDVDYTVSGISNDGGGVVTFFSGPAIGSQVTILRNQAQEQFSVYTQNGFSPRQVEKDLDKLTMQVQQLQEQLNRALQFLPSSTALPLVDPPTEGAFARAKVGGGVDWATPVGVSSLSLPVSITNGGTGSSTAPGALASLGAASDTGSTLIDAKGDLLVGRGDNTWAKVPAGTDGSVLSANSALTAGVEWVASGAALISTGDIKFTIKKVADTGWIMLNDGTIGDGSSGGTTRANGDTQNLYVLMWTNCPDRWCPVTGGRGADAASDFAAHKPMQIPRAVGRVIAGWHPTIGPVTVSNGLNADVDLTSNNLTVFNNGASWITGMPVTFTLTSGTITGLTSGTTYFVIRTGPTTVQLATTLANAQAGTAIDFTAKSSPVWQINYQSNPREFGEYLGEESHAMSSTELLRHAHTGGSTGGTVGGGSGSLGTAGTGNTGANNAMNTLQPTIYLGVMMKL